MNFSIRPSNRHSGNDPILKFLVGMAKKMSKDSRVSGHAHILATIRFLFLMSYAAVISSGFEDFVMGFTSK